MTITKIADYPLAAQFSCLAGCQQLSPTVAEGDDTGFTPKDHNDPLYK